MAARFGEKVVSSLEVEEDHVSTAVCGSPFFQVVHQLHRMGSFLWLPMRSNAPLRSMISPSPCPFPPRYWDTHPLLL